MVALLDQALSLIGLGSIPDRGQKSPETRLKSANDARRLLAECLKEDAPRSLERAIVKGCVDGNPPYPEPRPAERRWEANLNLGKGKGVMKRTGVPYFNLFARVQCYIECKTAFRPDHPDFNKWNASIALRLHNLLQRWEDFSWTVQQISYWMRLHGIGFAYFDKDYDWRFRPVETGNVLVPKGAPSCIGDRLPYVFIRIPYRVHELWEKIKDEKSAIAAGWNIEATRNAIKYGMRGMMGAQGQANNWYGRPWEEYQRILTNNELTASYTDGDLINCAVILLREYSGKISKFIFTEAEVAGQEIVSTNPDAQQTNEFFLFSDPNCYERYRQAIVPFFRNGGDNDGQWHSVRGYAQESFKHVEAENRLVCRGLDRAFLNSSVFWQYPNEQSRSEGQLVQIRGVIVSLPSKGEQKQLAIQGGIDEVLGMQRLISNHLEANIGLGTSRGMSRDDGKGETKTAREVDYTANTEGSISEAEITNYYAQHDAVYTTVFDRAADPSNSDPEAKRFREECMEDGVPAEALADMEYIRASRQNGYGSPEMAQIKFTQSKELVQMFPEEGKQAWLRNAVTSIHGPQAAKEFVPDTHIPDDQDWQASVENEMFANGRTPIVSSGQNDVIHLTSHFQDAQKTLGPISDTIESGGKADPAELQKAMTYVQAGGPNWEAHIQRLQGDPSRKQEAKLFTDQFQVLLSFSGKLYVAFRRAQRQAQLEQEQAGQTTALDALNQAKVESVRTGTALAAEKTRSSIHNSTVKTVEGINLKRVKTAAEIEDKRAARVAVPADIAS